MQIISLQLPREWHLELMQQNRGAIVDLSPADSHH